MVVSLIVLPGRQTWLFAGVYPSLGYKALERPRPDFEYVLEKQDVYEPLDCTAWSDFHFN